MHSMLEEYYDFLSERLISWAKKASLTAGERYVLNFENVDEVKGFISELQKLDGINNFYISSDYGSGFSGLSYQLSQNNGMQFVIVSTINVTSAYLVSLRNQIGKQSGIWENTVLLFISDKRLDSINRGAKDISRQGGPFNLNELRQNLNEEIKFSKKLSDNDKKSLNTMVQAMFDDDQTYTLMDFADVYAVIEKGKIEKADFNQMGYFYDADLPTYSNVEERLTENHADFSQIALLHGYGDVKDRVSKIVAGDGLINELSKDDWEAVDYRRVQTGKDELKKQSNIKINYLVDDLKDKNPGFEIWDRPENENTARGNKNRNIIIFNPSHVKNVQFKLPFDQAVKSEYITSRRLKDVPDFSVNISGHSLALNFSNLDDRSSKSIQIAYKHQDKGALRFVFNIVILPFEGSLLESVRPFYKLTVKNNQKFTINLPSDIADFYLGDGTVERKIKAHSVKDLNGEEITNDERISIDTSDLSLTDDLKDPFEIIIAGTPIGFLLIDEETRIVPKSALSLELFRRQHKIDGHYENEKIKFGETISSVYTEQKKFLQNELEAIQSDKLSEIDGLEISDNLKNSYAELFEELRNRHTLMSLVYWDETILQLVENIIDEVRSEISRSESNIELDQEVNDIVHIGEYQINNSITFAPFSPILLSYQLGVEKEISVESLSESIQQKLNPMHLAPFLKRNDKDYKAYFSNNSPRWLLYSESKLSKFSEVSRSIVTERLKDFKKHFAYLFELNPESSYNIRFVNITDEKAVLKSLVNYLIDQLEKSIKNKQNVNDINPLNAYIIEDKQKIVGSDFDEFYKIKTNTDFEDFFSEPLKIKGINTDERTEVIEVIKKKLNVFFGNIPNVSYHITFYQFSNSLTLDSYNSEKLNMNYSIGGLIGGDEYTNVQDSIKDGFGTKGLDEGSELLGFAKSWNELLAATNKKHSVMQHGQTLTNNVEELDSSDFQSQFDKSKWVTLLNPEVKLDYFNKMSRDIYVIHYTDYTNSANYESITLTKQVEQYENILSENLPVSVTRREDYDYLVNIIKSFNVINGEWLLRLVSHRNQQNTVKEKLSMLAVYKEVLGILSDSEVTWIPLSLEEILRVSGSFIGESRDSIFSAKSLNSNGKTSDDLLFMGLWKQNDQLKITFLPTEVKVGQNNSTTIKKADIQVEKTYGVFEDQLINNSDFKSLFYLDFFMKLFFANAAKLFSNGDLTKEKYEELQMYKQDIVQGKINVDNSLTDFYHNKFVFSLKADNINRSIQLTDKYTMIEVPEMDAFEFPGVPMQEVINTVQDNKFGFDSSRLLKSIWHGKDDNNQINESDNDIEYLEANALDETGFEIPETKEITDRTSEIETESEEENDSAVENNSDMEADLLTSQENENDELKPNVNRKILIGTVDGSNDKVSWEYDLAANRHMLITGKSGQGKTYFMQTLLLELSKQKVDTMVVDYTDSYLPGQLDPILDQTGKVNQRIVRKDKLPINPFKRQNISIGTFSYLEEDRDVASRIAEVIDFVFKLGPQQKSKLIQALNEGMSRNENYTFTMLKRDLTEKSGDTLYGRIQPLLDNDPFIYSDNDFDWSKYFGKNGNINIIQMSGFPFTVKNALIEFLLWNLFNYSQIKADQNLIYPVFLDEVQNLNFAQNAPTVKILREGRKFGWSGIFATQSLSSIKGETDAVYNAAEQVHFMPPENQIKFIAKTLSSNSQLQNEYEQRLSHLRKSQCIVNGSVVGLNKKLVKNISTVNIDSLEKRQ